MEFINNPNVARGGFYQHCIGPNNVNVPTHVFKVYVEDIPRQRLRVLACYCAENRLYPLEMDFRLLEWNLPDLEQFFNFSFEEMYQDNARHIKQ